jgi:transcription elongation factor Elf1
MAGKSYRMKIIKHAMQTNGNIGNCPWCGEENTPRDLIVHHKDGNHSNNEVKNLVIGHNRCHSKYHNKPALQKIEEEEGTMILIFVCDTCGKYIQVKDPVTLTRQCECGGILRASTFQAQKTIKVVPYTQLEETSLMGMAWRGEL